MRLLLLAAMALSAGAADPIRLHPHNPNYFEFRGKPTALITSAEHYGAVLHGRFDFRKYLATLAADGLNYTRLFTGAYQEVPGSFGIMRNNLAPGEHFVAPWPRRAGAFALEEWNADYFARLQAFMEAASQRGIVVEVTFFTSTYTDKEWAVHPFNGKNNGGAAGPVDFRKLNTLDNGGTLKFQEALVRKLVRELNGFDNVIFEIQNEPWADRTVVADVINPYLPAGAKEKWPNTADLADEASLAWQQRVAEWVAAEESRLPSRHLLAQNVCNFRYPVRSVARGVSIINFHYAYPEAALWNLHHGKAIACDETGFMGTADRHYRMQAWRFLLSGGAIYNNLDYSFSTGFEDGTDVQSKSPGGGSVALRKQLGVMKRFFEALPFLEMKPDFQVVRAAPGVWTQAFSKPGSVYAIHISGKSPAELSLELPAAGTWSAEWVDTKTGASTPASLRAGRVTTPAFDEDVVLRAVRR